MDSGYSLYDCKLSQNKTNKWAQRFPWRKVHARFAELLRQQPDYTEIRTALIILQAEIDVMELAQTHYYLVPAKIERALREVERKVRIACDHWNATDLNKYGVKIGAFRVESEIADLFALWIEEFVVWRISMLLSVSKQALMKSEKGREFYENVAYAIRLNLRESIKRYIDHMGKTPTHMNCGHIPILIQITRDMDTMVRMSIAATKRFEQFKKAGMA